MLCGIDNILHNISHTRTQYGKYPAKYCQSHITMLKVKFWHKSLKGHLIHVGVFYSLRVRLLRHEITTFQQV